MKKNYPKNLAELKKFVCVNFELKVFFFKANRIFPVKIVERKV